MREISNCPVSLGHLTWRRRFNEMVRKGDGQKRPVSDRIIGDADLEMRDGWRDVLEW